MFWKVMGPCEPLSFSWVLYIVYDELCSSFFTYSWSFDIGMGPKAMTPPPPSHAFRSLEYILFVRAPRNAGAL